MSAVPAFLDALAVKCGTAASLAGWQVVDGPPLEESSGRRLLALGISTDDLTVESESTHAGLGSRRERADVTCLARSWSGDEDLAVHRRDAFAGVAAVEALLAADRRVGGSVTQAWVVARVYTPVRGSRGTAAEVEFRIRVDAFS